MRSNSTAALHDPHAATAAPEPPAPGPTGADARPLLRGWIHLVAVVVTVIAAPFVVARAPTAGAAAALAVYMTAIAALFGVSAAFHRVRWSPPARRRMRRADHATIFIAIAGTYTAVAGLALAGWAQILILCLVWGGAAVGITVRQLWLDAPKWAVAMPYVVVGWCALAVLPQLLHSLGGAGFGLSGRRRRLLHPGGHRLLAAPARPCPRCLRLPRGLPRLHRGRRHPALRGHRHLRAAAGVGGPPTPAASSPLRQGRRRLW